MIRRVTLCLAGVLLMCVTLCLGALVRVGEWLVELMAECTGDGNA